MEETPHVGTVECESPQSPEVNFELNHTFTPEPPLEVEKVVVEDEGNSETDNERVSMTIESTPVEPILPNTKIEEKQVSEEPAFEVEAADDEDKNYTPL